MTLSLRFLVVACGLSAQIALAGPTLASTLLVANKSDDTVDLIDLESGLSKATLPTGHGPHEIAVSPDGSQAVIANYGDREKAGSSLSLVDIAAAKLIRTIDLGSHRRPHGLQWISADRLIVTTEGSGSLLVVDPITGEIDRAVATGQEISHMVAVTPDGRRAFSANIGSGSVTVVDLEIGAKLRDIATGGGAEGIAVTPDGRELWVANREADTLTIIDTSSLDVLANIPCPGFPIRVAMTPDGRHVLISAARSGEVAVFDAATRRELRRGTLDLSTAPDAADRLFGERFGRSPVPVGLVVDPSGERAWVAATQADAVVVVHPVTLAIQGLLRAGREPDGMAWSPTAVHVAIKDSPHPP